MKGFIGASVVLTLLICAIVFCEVLAFVRLDAISTALDTGENEKESAKKALSLFNKYENLFLISMNAEYVYNTKAAICALNADTDEQTYNAYLAESRVRVERMKKALFV